MANKKIKMTGRKYILTILFFLTGSGLAGAQNADSIVQCYLNAIGGIARLHSIKTIKMYGITKMEGGKIPVTITKVIGKAVRTDYYSEGKNNFEILTAKEGWKNDPITNEVEKMSDREVLLKQPRRQLDNNDIIEYKENNTRLEYLGEERTHYALCHKVKFTTTKGFEVVYYFDVNTCYMMHSQTKIRHDGREIIVDTDYKNYKQLPGGIAMPMAMESFTAGNLYLDSVKINTPVDESVFRP